MSERTSTHGYLVGGDTYGLDELKAPRGSVSSSLPTVDRVTGGGIPWGGVWGLMGLRGVGVTNLALQIAVDAARLGESVVFVNDHVDSGSIRERVERLAGTHGLSTPAAVDGQGLDIEFASWIPDPSLDDLGLARLNLWRTDPRLVVLDTLRDIEFFPKVEPQSVTDHIERLRMWRAWARRWGRCVLVTLRVPDAAGHRASPDELGLAFPAYAAVLEIVDTLVTMRPRGERVIGEVMVSVDACRRGPEHRGFVTAASSTTLRLSEVAPVSPRLEK